MKGKRADNELPPESQSMAEREETVKEAGGTVKAPKEKKPRPIRGEQQDLIPNRELVDVERKAREYKAVLNKRQDLTKREVELQADLLNLMHRHKLTVYDHDGVHAEIVIEKERVRVKIKSEEDDEGDE